MAKNSPLISQEQIESAVVSLRGEQVLLDADLAALYGVDTKALNQAVKRNRSRFPADFMFRLTAEETAELNRSQFVTGSQRHRDPRYPPFAFTEQGVAMLSSVLRSARAVQVNIEIMRAFVRLRRILAVNSELSHRLDELERRLGQHDEQFIQVIRAIRQLMEPTPRPPRRTIGFHATDAAKQSKSPDSVKGGVGQGRPEPARQVKTAKGAKRRSRSNQR